MTPLSTTHMTARNTHRARTRRQRPPLKPLLVHRRQSTAFHPPAYMRILKTLLGRTVHAMLLHEDVDRRCPFTNHLSHTDTANTHSAWVGTFRESATSFHMMQQSRNEEHSARVLHHGSFDVVSRNKFNMSPSTLAVLESLPLTLTLDSVSCSTRLHQCLCLQAWCTCEDLTNRQLQQHTFNIRSHVMATTRKQQTRTKGPGSWLLWK